MHFTASVSLAALMASAPLYAQETPSPEEVEAVAQDEYVLEDGTIVVRAERLRGQLDVDQPPLVEYSAEDIAAFGANSISDLLEQLEPVTGSNRGRGGGGRPIFLVNGVRIGSFREFRSYPPEAIEKVEVFQEEVAQRFGFSADRRVVNFVLKDNFSARTVEVEFEQPESGGFSRNEQEFTLLKIADGGRINVNLQANDTSLLTESERDLDLIGGSQSDLPGDPDPLEFRSLIADSARYQGEFSYAKAFLDTGASVSANVTASRNESLSLSGLDDVLLVAPDGTSAFRTFGADDPLTRRIRSDNLSTSGSYSRSLGLFQLTATADAGVTDSRTLIDRQADTQFLVDAAASGALVIDGPITGVPDAGRDRADSTFWAASSLLTLRGLIAELPAGDVNATFDLGYDWDRIESSDTRTDQDIELTRGNLAGGFNVGVPITSTRNGVWDAIGSLTVNAQAGFDYLSDFGTLYDWSLGATWAPTDKLSLTATHTWREQAPGLTALGNPIVETFNVPIFDFVGGQTVLADVTSGGNPNLEAETQRDWNFSLNWELPLIPNARFQTGYTTATSDDVTLQSPSFTSSFEAAFPDRVTRDGIGQLTAVDLRPVTLFETRSESVFFSLNMGGSIGKAPPRRSGPPGGGRPGGSGRPGAGGPPSGGSGRPPAGATSARFDPAQFAEIRAKFCATPEGEAPDLSGLPEQMLERLKGPDGTIPPDRIAQLRERFCGEESEQRGERFAAIREAVCADPPQLDKIPEPMLARIKGPDGEINPDKLAQMREQICSADGAASGGQQAGQGQPGAGRGGGRRRGGAGFFGGNENDPRPRYFLNLTHTIQLENEILLAENGPLFDQLDGFVISGGAIPGSTSRLEAGLFWQGYGFRLSGNYIGEAELRSGQAPGSNDLFFGDIATFDIRLFADLGEVLKKEDGIFDGLRVSLRADNIFDAQRRVVDANGVVPGAFDPDRLDPTGRYLGIDIRKAF